MKVGDNMETEDIESTEKDSEKVKKVPKSVKIRELLAQEVSKQEIAKQVGVSIQYVSSVEKLSKK